MPAKEKKKRAEIDARRHRVAALLLSRKTHAEIADALKVSVRTIVTDARELKKLWQKELIDDPVAIKAKELAEMDDMERDCSKEFMATRSSEWIDRRLRIKERRSKLLGLDAPQKRELSGPKGAPIRVDTKTPKILDKLMANPAAFEALEQLNVVMEEEVAKLDDEDSEPTSEATN